MERPKITEYTFPKKVEDVPLPIADPGGLLQLNAGFRSSKPVLDNEKCVGCMLCYLLCPDGTIYKNGGRLAIDYDFCKGCGICAHECKLKAINMVPEE